jgi:CheY-like chemotaxis protein
MFFKHWPVLLVDDEPDVLTVSKLAMKNFEVYGLPLKIYTAASKAEAIELMKDDVEVGCALAVAFLDVVMETDSAGLELCDYIRNTMNNQLTQLFIRTGQPGVCPEREVIDKYDINGYFTKMEATEDKLYSLIKSSVRQYLAFGMASETLSLVNELVAASGSRRKIRYVLTAVSGIVPDFANAPRWILIDGELLNPSEDSHANETMQTLLASISNNEGFLLNPEGDCYISDHQGNHLLKVCAAGDKAEVIFLFMSSFEPPLPIVEMMHAFVHALAIVWQKSSDD